MSIPSPHQLALELVVDHRAICRYSDEELLRCVARILARPGKLTERDLAEIAIVTQAFQMRERFLQMLKAQMN